MVAKDPSARKLAQRASLRVLILCFIVISVAIAISATTQWHSSSPGGFERALDRKPTLSLDLNAATESQLCALPTVGPSLAGRIVRWRTENGPFETVDDLRQVHGVGDATIAEIGPLLRVASD